MIICPKCGKPVHEYDRFCENCGAQLQSPQVTEPESVPAPAPAPAPKTKAPMPRDRKIIIALVAAVVVVGGIVGALALGGGDASAYSKKMETAQQYVSEGNYDAAAIEFNEAIKIKPKKDDAYIKLSKMYWDMGDRKQARDTLQRGRTETGHEDVFDEELDRIGAAEADEDEEGNVTDGDPFAYFYWEVNEIGNEYGDVCTRYNISETGATDSYKVYSDDEGMFNFVFIGSGDNPDPNYDWDGIVLDTDPCQRMSGTAEYMFNLTEDMSMEDLCSNYGDYMHDAPSYGHGNDLETSTYHGQLAVVEIEDEQFVMLLRDVDNFGTITPDTMVDMTPFNGDFESFYQLFE